MDIRKNFNNKAAWRPILLANLSCLTCNVGLLYFQSPYVNMKLSVPLLVISGLATLVAIAGYAREKRSDSSPREPAI